MKKAKSFAVYAGIAALWTAVVVMMFTGWLGEMPQAETEKTAQKVEQPKPTVQVEEVITYDVPLDEDLKQYIISECESKGVDPAVLFGMIEQESGFNADAIGDGGDSLGLMQIQYKWHGERMERLGCNDLLDPYQNVKLGIDILHELIGYYCGDLEQAVIAYNCGVSGAHNNYFSQGLYESEYSKNVMANAESIKGVAYEYSR